MRYGDGLKELLYRMADLLADRVSRVELALPLDRTDLLSLLHRTSLVIDVTYEDSHVSVVALVSSKVYARVEPFLVRRDPGDQRVDRRCRLGADDCT